MFISVLKSFKSFKKYTKSHEWVTFDTSTKLARVGISNFAQGEIGEVVHLELPQLNRKLKKGQSFATIESVKVASQIYSPAHGRVVQNNKDVESKSELINKQAQSSWISELQLEDERDLDDLLTEEQYKKTLQK